MVLAWLGRLVVIRMMQQYQEKSAHKPARSLLVKGSTLLVAGCTLYLFLYDVILDLILDWQLQLKEGGFIFNAWKSLPFPLRIRIWVFELENGEDYQDGSAYPVVRDVGPFYFDEYRTRQVLGWSHGNGVVEFKENLRFSFDENQSVHSLEHRVKVINTPLLLFLGFIKSKVEQFYLSMFNPLVSNLLYLVFRYFDENIVEERSVADILTGREIGVLKIVDSLSRPLRSMGIEVPLIGVGIYKLTQNSFGFLHLRHNQTFGPAEMYTGQTDSGQFNTFHSLNGARLLPFFQDKGCNKIRGTEGTFYGKKLGQNKPVYVYNPHLCRPLKFDYIRESSVGAIFTQRYEMDRQMFSIRNRPENWCYCPKSAEPSDCEGQLYMSQCLDGAPLTLTNAHFLSSPGLARKVRGLKPDPRKHQGYLEIEPILGAAIEAAIRVQLNLDLQPYPLVASLRQMKAVTMPYLWLEEGALVSGYLKYLLTAGSLFFAITSYLFLATAAVGVMLILVAISRIAKQNINRHTSVKDASNEVIEKQEIQQNRTSNLGWANTQAGFSNRLPNRKLQSAYP